MNRHRRDTPTRAGNLTRRLGANLATLLTNVAQKSAPLNAVTATPIPRPVASRSSSPSMARSMAAAGSTSSASRSSIWRPTWFSTTTRSAATMTPTRRRRSPMAPSSSIPRARNNPSRLLRSNLVRAVAGLPICQKRSLYVEPFAEVIAISLGSPACDRTAPLVACIRPERVISSSAVRVKSQSAFTHSKKRHNGGAGRPERAHKKGRVMNVTKKYA